MLNGAPGQFLARLYCQDNSDWCDGGPNEAHYILKSHRLHSMMGQVKLIPGV